MIPKIIHQIWLGGKPIPNDHLEYMKGWIRNHPGWTYILWTEELINSVLTPVYPEVYEKAITWIEKHDLLRFDILYQFGGIHIDCDVESVKCIEPLTEGIDIFVSRWLDIGEEHPTHQGNLNGATMGCSKNSLIMRELLDKIPESQQKYQPSTPPPFAFGIMTSAEIAGPYFLDREVLNDDRIFKPSKVFLSPYYSESEAWKPASMFPEAYAIHRWSGFWHPGGRDYDPETKDSIKL